jgi:hypothetical protein
MFLHYVALQLRVILEQLKYQRSSRGSVQLTPDLDTILVPSCIAGRTVRTFPRDRDAALPRMFGWFLIQIVLKISRDILSGCFDASFLVISKITGTSRRWCSSMRMSRVDHDRFESKLLMLLGRAS